MFPGGKRGSAVGGTADIVTLASSVAQRGREQTDGVRLGGRAADHPAGVDGPPRRVPGTFVGAEMGECT